MGIRHAGLFLILAGVFSSVAVLVSASQIVTFDSVGPVSIGMTVAQAEHAIGAKLKSFAASGADSEECWLTARADGADPGIIYMINGKRVVRIGIYHEENRPFPDAATAAQIGLGSMESDIKRVYGATAKIGPAPYYPEGETPVGHDITVEAPTGKSALLFETVDGKLDNFRVGLHGPLEYIEGCD